MNPRAVAPAPTFRSPTAMGGKSGVRDDNWWSSALLQHQGAGQTRLFTSSHGQPVVFLRGAGIAPSTNAWQTLYTEVTTSVAKPGELGAGVGEVSFRAIGCSIEQAKIDPVTGEAEPWGATQYDAADIAAKTFIVLKVSNHEDYKSRLVDTPAPGGIFGSVATGGTASPSIVTNGWPGSMRRLSEVIPCARNDSLECVLGIAGGSMLDFAVGEDPEEGRPTLVTVTLFMTVFGDVRG